MSDEQRDPWGIDFRLAIDGDVHEQQACALFLPGVWPEYELFWRRHVVPLTNRPLDLHFKDEEQLDEEGRHPSEFAIAQLHYSVLIHLSRAFRWTRSPGIGDTDQVYIVLSSLHSLQDVAIEMIQRFRRQEAGSSYRLLEDGKSIRNDWYSEKRENKEEPWPPGVKLVRDYRNALIHGRLLPGSVRKDGMSVVPRPEYLDQMLDWRKVTRGTLTDEERDREFQPVAEVLDWAWHETVAFLRDEWATLLKLPKSKVRSPPTDRGQAASAASGEEGGQEGFGLKLYNKGDPVPPPPRDPYRTSGEG